MTGSEFLSLITQGTYILITLVALYEYFRYRDQARLDVLLMFGDFALIILLQRLMPGLGSDAAWISEVNSILLVAHPYLLLRLIQHLRPVPARMRLFALAGMLASWLAILIFPNPLPAVISVPIVIYFVIVEGYSAYAMVDGARKTAGVVNNRLLLAAAGSSLIAALILVAGIVAVFPGAAQELSPVSQLLGLLAVICYFLGFATPYWLRRVWQLSELYRFLHSAPEPRAGQFFEDSLQRLSSAAQRAAGGQLAVIALWDDGENHLTIRASSAASSNPYQLPGSLPLDHPTLQLAWQERKPVVLRLPTGSRQHEAGSSTLEESTALLAVPIANQERAWGMLLVYLLRTPLFASDDLNLLSLLSEQTAISLGYARLLAEQENLIDRLRRYTQRLEAIKEIDYEILAARLPEEIAEVALSLVKRVVPFERASVLLFDFEQNQAQVIAVEEQMNLGPKKGTTLSIRDLPSLEALSDQILVIDDASTVQSPFWVLELHKSQGIHSLMLVPLTVESKLIGALSLSSREAYAFQAEHRDIAREIAGQLAITLQQARLREELQRTNAELEQRVALRTAQLESAVQDLQKEISARKQASEALRATQERLQFLLSATPAVIYSVDVTDRLKVNFVSENVFSQLGYEARSFSEDENFWASHIHPQDAERVLSSLRELPQTGYHTLEYRFQHKNGGYIWMHDEFRVICDEQGNPIEMVGYWIDITKRRQAEDAIQLLNEDLTRRALELQAANRELEAFTYSVSHDLRSPLRAIDGFSRVLLNSHAAELSDEARRYFNLVRENTRDMGQLIDDLLAFSQINQQSLNIKTVEPAGIVRLALRDLLKEHEGREVKIVTGDLPTCKADPILLKQVFANLLSNALKFTSKREKARIEVGGQAQDGELLYYVKDNGIGFDMQYAGKLFGVFQRLHRAEDYEGTGVGLAIVQRIVSRHGGRVWAEAELDKGAAFYFTLPCEYYEP